LERWFRIVLSANNRDKLFEGHVRLPTDAKRKYGFDSEMLSRQQKDEQALHRARLESMKTISSLRISGSDWIKGWEDSCGTPLTPAHRQQLVERLDAAYRYDIELIRIVGNGGYNFEKHSGDWIDWQQLFYLCDPTVDLLTDDGSIRDRVGISPQRDRILGLRAFLGAHGFTPRH